MWIIRKYECIKMNTLKKINLLPLAAESLGVRSMSIFVQTPDIRILIDPGCALGPYRYKLFPHPKEYEKLIETTNKMINFSKKADYLVISHFHHDHFKPPIEDYFTLNSNLEIFNEIFTNKKILIKNSELGCSKNSINRSKFFISYTKNISESVQLADEKIFIEGETKICFSKPVFHGELNSKAGKVILTTIKYQNESILHSSDVQGPLLNETAKLIIKSNPNIAIIGGPPLYLDFFRNNLAYKVNAVKNMIKIQKKIPKVIFDHHLLRMQDWKDEIYNTVKNLGEKYVQFFTFASYLGLEENLLEANRKILYKKYPVSEKFVKWTLLNEKSKIMTPPPLDS